MDISQIKAKLAELEGKKQNSNSNSNKNALLWKPEPGKQVVRILPYKYRPEWPFLELSFHFEVAGRSLISPTSIDPSAPDPIIEFANKLRTTSDKDDWRIARKISPKTRYYVPILVRGKEDEGVKFWGHGQMVYTELLKHMDDPDYGDVTDPKEGRDVTVEYTEPTEKDKWGSTSIRVKPSTSPILSPAVVASPAGKLIMESIKTMPSVEEIFAVPTYDELKQLLDKYINAAKGVNEPEVTEPAEAEEDEKPLSDLPFDQKNDPKSTKKVKPAAEEKKKAVAEAFDDLFSM